MKKLISIIMAAIFAFAAFGCSAPAASVDIDPATPWKWLTYEKSVFTVEKWTQEFVDKQYRDKTKIAEGTLTIEVFVNEIIQQTKSLSRVKQTFEITYLDIPEAVDGKVNHRGKTDKITSEVTFVDSTLQPTKSSKTFTSPVRPDQEDLSFSFSADYSSKKATVEKGGKTSDINLAPSSQFFDNEQLYILVRALKNIKYNTTNSFNVSHIYDSYLNGSSYREYVVGASAKDVATTIEAGEKLQKYLTPDEKDGKYKVKCMQTAVGLNVNSYPTPGPDFTMYISEPDLKFNISEGVFSNKLIMKMVTVEHDVPAAKEKYHTYYNLTDYSTEKPTV